MKQLRSTLDMMMHSHTNRIGRARFGLVSASDPEAGLVKVRLQPENAETGWICDAAVSASGLICYSPSEIGSHVLVETAQGDGDNYVVIARVFDAVSRPAVFSVKNGKALQPGEFGVQSESSELVISSSGIALKGSVTIDGNLTVSGDASASGISLVHHVHNGVQTGSSQTGPAESV